MPPSAPFCTRCKHDIRIQDPVDTLRETAYVACRCARIAVSLLEASEHLTPATQEMADQWGPETALVLVRQIASKLSRAA